MSNYAIKHDIERVLGDLWIATCPAPKVGESEELHLDFVVLARPTSTQLDEIDRIANGDAHLGYRVSIAVLSKDADRYRPVLKWLDGIVADRPELVEAAALGLKRKAYELDALAAGYRAERKFYAEHAAPYTTLKLPRREGASQ